MQSIGQIFVESHRHAADVLLRKAPAVLLIALGALITTALTGLVRLHVGNEPARLLIGWILQSACLWFTAPAAVAIFRHVILGENTSANPFARTPEAEAFFTGAALINFLGVAALLARTFAYGGAPASVTTLGPLAGVSITLGIFLTRLTTYLPGVAVGRDRNSLAQALQESRGHFWYIFLSLFAAMAPVVAAGVTGSFILRSSAPGFAPFATLVMAIGLTIIGTCATALLYQNLRIDTPSTTLATDRLNAVLSSPSQRGGSFGRATYQPDPFGVASPAAAPRARISAIGIGAAAYRDLLNMAREMWPVLLLLSALYFVCAMAWFVAPLVVSTWVGRMIVRMLIFVGIAYIAAPFYVTLHRFVSTGEVRWIPQLDNRRYFGWSGLTVMLWFLPLILGDVADALLPRGATLVMLIGFIVVAIILVRMTTLLPAAALAPDKAGWAQAMDDSRGRFRLFWAATTGAVLPAIVLLVLIGRAAGSQTITALPFFAIAVPALLTLQLVPLAAGTRLYDQLRSDRITPRMRQVLRA